MSEPSETWKEGMLAFYRKGPVFEFCVIRQNDPRLALGLINGEHAALRVAEILSQWLATLMDKRQWPNPGGPRCLACDRRFKLKRLPAAFGILSPFGWDWHKTESNVVVVGICQHCATRSDHDLCTVVAKLQGGDVVTSGNA